MAGDVAVDRTRVDHRENRAVRGEREVAPPYDGKHLLDGVALEAGVDQCGTFRDPLMLSPGQADEGNALERLGKGVVGVEGIG
jgi:hypothetical protein